MSMSHVLYLRELCWATYTHVYCNLWWLRAQSQHGCNRLVTGGGAKQTALRLAAWLAGVCHVQVWQPGHHLQAASCQEGQQGVQASCASSNTSLGSASA